MEMWWETFQCRNSFLHKTPYAVTQRSPFYHTSGTKSSQKGIAQWSEGNSHWVAIHLLDHKGELAVKSIILQCTACLRYEGKPYTATPPPPLPEFHVREQPPFTYTGADFERPLHVKEKGDNGTSKVWIYLYICCMVQAVHLDIVPNLTTSDFLRSFKWFTAHCGLPQRLISNNAKMFHSETTLAQWTLTAPYSCE